MSDNCFSIKKVNYSKCIPNGNNQLSSFFIILYRNFNHTFCHELNNTRVSVDAKIISTIVQVAILISHSLSLGETLAAIQY